jgi:hypothetical protein
MQNSQRPPPRLISGCAREGKHGTPSASARPVARQKRTRLCISVAFALIAEPPRGGSGSDGTAGQLESSGMDRLDKIRSTTAAAQSGAGRRSMIFSPHTLVRTSFRLHFRGFADMADGRPGIYIDIIPDRVLRAGWLDSPSYVGASNDSDWHRKVRVVAYLREELPEKIATAMRHEHGIAHGSCLQTRPLRAAVATYVAGAFSFRQQPAYMAAHGLATSRAKSALEVNSSGMQLWSLT